MSRETGIVYPKTEDYLQGLVRPSGPLLKDLEKDAETNDVPIIGPVAGSILTQIAIASCAKLALEVGTATGYSGILLGRPISRNSGKLITIERDPDRIKTAQRNIQKAGISKNVEILVGDAREIVSSLAKERKGEFDVVFLDVGEKFLYVELLEPIVDLLREGGYLIADNVLRGGCVAESSDKERNTVAIRKFNKKVFADKRLLPVIVPLRDGVLIALKVSSK